MQLRALGRTGLHVSEISLGGAYLHGPDANGAFDNAAAIVRRAAELGINYIDTAPQYGRSEELLGFALRDIEHDFHVATKIGFDPKDFDYRRDSVLWSLERSLTRLGIDQLAVAQVHEVNYPGWDRLMAPGHALAGLRAAQERGLCRCIGITGRAIPLLRDLAATGEFDTLLVYHDYHPCSRLAADFILPAAVEQQMGVILGTPLGGGLFGSDAARERALQRLKSEEDRARASRVIDRLRQEPFTLPQASFRYLLCDDRISTISSGAATVEQLEEVAAAAEMGRMEAALRDEIERLAGTA